MIFFHILWWVLCIPLALGLLGLLGFVLVSVFAFIISGPTDNYVESEGPNLLPFFLIIVLLLTVPAAIVLSALWLLGMAPEDFSFLGSSPISPLPLPLPNYYSVGQAVTWITIAILFAGPIWATISTIAALRRRIAKRQEGDDGR
jgi:hypothetical protein